MTGKPGRSGGLRPGAGRPQTRFILRRGMQLLVSTTHPDGAFEAGYIVEVSDFTMKTLTLTVTQSNQDNTGAVLRLLR